MDIKYIWTISKWVEYLFGSQTEKNQKQKYQYLEKNTQ